MKIDKTKRYYRLKYGYEKSDRVTFSEDVLERVIYARAKKGDILLDNKLVSCASNYFIIEPNYAVYLGYGEDYHPSDGRDWDEVREKCPNFDGALENFRNRVAFLIKKNRVGDIGKNVIIAELSESGNSVVNNQSGIALKVN